jgi:hypothetical protein
MSEIDFEKSFHHQSTLSRRERLFHLLEKEGLTEEMMQRAIDVPEIRKKIVEYWKIQGGAYLTMEQWKKRRKE